MSQCPAGATTSQQRKRSTLSSSTYAVDWHSTSTQPSGPAAKPTSLEEYVPSHQPFAPDRSTRTRGTEPFSTPPAIGCISPLSIDFDPVRFNCKVIHVITPYILSLRSPIDGGRTANCPLWSEKRPRFRCLDDGGIVIGRATTALRCLRLVSPQSQLGSLDVCFQRSLVKCNGGILIKSRTGETNQ